MQRGEAAIFEIFGDGLIGGEHELLDQAMGDVALAAHDAGDATLVVKGEQRLRQIEVHRAAPGAPCVKDQREVAHSTEALGQRGVTLGGLGVALDHAIHVGVGHALDRADHAGGELGARDRAVVVELQQGALHQTILARLERADAVGQILRQHGNGAIGEINGGAAQARLAIERGIALHVMRDVGDVHLQIPAVRAALDVDGVVKIARGFAVNGDDGKIAKIAAAVGLRGGDGLGRGLRLVDHVFREAMRQVVLANHDFDVDAEFVRPAEDFDDAARRGHAAAREARDLHVNHGAIERVNDGGGDAMIGCRRRGVPAGAPAHHFVAGWDDDFLEDARFERHHDIAARPALEQADHGGVHAIEHLYDAAFGAARAFAGSFGGKVAPGEAAALIAALDARHHTVAMHGVAGLIGRDEKVAVNIRPGRLGHHEAVSVAMRDQPADQEIGIAAKRRGLVFHRRGDGACAGLLGGLLAAGMLPCLVTRLLRGAVAVGELEAASSKLGETPAPFETGHHFGQRAPAGVAEPQGRSYLPEGQGIAGLSQEGKQGLLGEFFGLGHFGTSAIVAWRVKITPIINLDYPQW